MASKFTVKVGHSGNGLTIIIPKPICDGSNIKQGDFLTIYDYVDKIVIPLGKKEPELILSKKAIEMPRDDDKITKEKSSPVETTDAETELADDDITVEEINPSETTDPHIRLIRQRD